MPFSAPAPTAVTNPFLPFPPMTPEAQQQQWNYYLQQQQQQQQQHANVVASSVPTNIVNGQFVPPTAKPRAPVPTGVMMPPPRPAPAPTAAPARPEVYAMSEDGLSTVESVVIPTAASVIEETVVSSSSSDFPQVVDESEI